MAHLVHHVTRDFVFHLSDINYRRRMQAGLAEPERAQRATSPLGPVDAKRLITSQIDTAPKPGHRVVPRNPDIHLQADGNTSDALVDGMTCDYKRIASASLKKAVRKVTGKLERQGPSFTLDLTVSKIGAGGARVRMVMLLDDPKIEVIHIVTGNGSIETIKK